jgi:transposase
MSQGFKPFNRDQSYLLPPSLRDWLPEGDLAYFIIDVAESLDLGGIYRYYEVSEGALGEGLRPKANSGQPPFHPEMMVALLLYAYCNGTPSSRRIARLCEREAGYRVVSADQQPNFRTISEFRRIHLKALKGLFVQVLHLAREAGLVKLGHVALDSTKVKANASKHKAMSYARMCEREAEYAREVEELLRRAQETDETEDMQYGKELRGDELPEELRFRASRLRKIREAKQALEEAAKEKARAEGKLDENGAPTLRTLSPQGEREPPRRGRVPATPPGTPQPSDQRNFTDPESRIMKMGNGSFDQAYNCQAAVDSKSQVIVAEEAINASNDKQLVEPMVEQIQENLRQRPKKLMADSGYYSEGNVRYLRRRKIDDYLCPDRVKHSRAMPRMRGRIPKGLSFIDRVRRRLWRREGRITYALRKQIVEPVFGQMKQVRGLRQFLLRGLEKVQGEWSLWCTTHNLLKLWVAASG